MGKRYKTVKVPATKREVVESISCDYCPAEARMSNDYQGQANWKNDAYDVDVVVIEHTEGTAYPEGSYLEVDKWHICSDCFKRLIEPVLEENMLPERKHEKIEINY